jgi:hypothetical protein
MILDFTDFCHFSYSRKWTLGMLKNLSSIPSVHVLLNEIGKNQ